MGSWSKAQSETPIQHRAHGTKPRVRQTLAMSLASRGVLEGFKVEIFTNIRSGEIYQNNEVLRVPDSGLRRELVACRFNRSLLFRGGPKKGKRSDRIPSEPSVKVRPCSYVRGLNRAANNYASLMSESDIPSVRVDCGWRGSAHCSWSTRALSRIGFEPANFEDINLSKPDYLVILEEEAYEEVEEEAPKDEAEIEVEPHPSALSGPSRRELGCVPILLYPASCSPKCLLTLRLAPIGKGRGPDEELDILPKGPGSLSHNTAADLLRSKFFIQRFKVFISLKVRSYILNITRCKPDGTRYEGLSERFKDLWKKKRMRRLKRKRRKMRQRSK
ncbi:hypothetical protein HAX54_030127 [Datura stramonium]|uniref:60S ribosomal protein L41 n=1 Tax=Datura stramonium TaxID=4076 RepID=A0ABS8V7J3_DATST|nr:hypothetical protein [Datura stramonium]